MISPFRCLTSVDSYEFAAAVPGALGPFAADRGSAFTESTKSLGQSCRRHRVGTRDRFLKETTVMLEGKEECPATAGMF